MHMAKSSVWISPYPSIRRERAYRTSTVMLPVIGIIGSSNGTPEIVPHMNFSPLVLAAGLMGGRCTAVPYTVLAQLEDYDGEVETSLGQLLAYTTETSSYNSKLSPVLQRQTVASGDPW